MIIGAGVAGLCAALELSKKGSVLVVNKTSLTRNSSNWAQGGIAVQGNLKDSVQSHIEDTYKAGSQLGNLKAIKFLVEASKKVPEYLNSFQIKFDRDNSNSLLYSKEGGHSQNRIISHKDSTGKEIMRNLLKYAQKNKNIQIIHPAYCSQLIIREKICIGSEVYFQNKKYKVESDYTLICGGGSGALFKFTTNPESATGDSIALAKKAGIKLKNLEFIQFHPTSLASKGRGRKFLLSEVLRGEGAIIINEKNQRFLKKIHSLAELAPRDIVARSCFQESLKGKIFLQFKNKNKDFLEKRFPQIYKHLAKIGIKMERDKIPFIPAAHYQCGGIITNLKGETNIKNCFAIGEAANTGIHGANRLASNSLLEGIVFAINAANSIELSPLKKLKKIEAKAEKTLITDSEKNRINKIKNKIKEVMWEKVGIIRSQSGLRQALTDLEKLKKQLKQIKNENNRQFAECENMIEASTSIVNFCQKRKKSIGTHYLINS